MAVTGLILAPSKVIIRLGVVSLSTDGTTYYGVGMAKNIKITAKPIYQVDNAKQNKTVGYIITAAWQMMQTSSTDAVMTLHNIVNTATLYVKILNSVANIKRVLGPTFVGLDETNLDFDGGEGYVKASCTYITDPTTAQTLMAGAVGP